VDIRVIATTNKDLYAESAEGRFREDLFYRLSVFPISIPPLRERPEDIEALAGHFLKKFSSAMSRKVEGFSPEAMDLLMSRPWRGNVRELENAVQRAVLLAGSPLIQAADFMLPAGETQAGAPRASAGGSLREAEREMILRTLDEVNGNKTRAARVLGVSVRTIRNKLNEYGKNLPAR